jgi:RNA polymerase sigma factor (TIGR02999 family)
MQMSDDVFATSGDLGASPEVKQTAQQLLPMLYNDVRRLARRERQRMRAGETLQTTALIHEAYLRLHRSDGFNDQAHFLRSAALAMRHSLINYARDQLAEKRGGGAAVETLDQAMEVESAEAQDLLEMNEALARLGALSPRLAQVVECRFFAGYDDRETAQALGLAERTVRRDWVKARAWLRRELAGSGAAAEPPSS